MTRTTPFLIAALAALLAAPAGRAEPPEYGPLTDRFEISLGGFEVSTDTRLRVDAIESEQLGTTLNVERLLGVDPEENVFRADAVWRIRPRHRLRLAYFDDDRRASVDLESEIDFGDETFPVGVDLSSDLDTTIIELAYEYSVLRRENFELALAAGVHNVQYALRLEALPVAGGAGIVIEEDMDADAPLPVFGINATWRAWRDVYVLGRAQYFQLEVGDYDGSITDLQAEVLWQFSRHVGIGAGYSYFETDIEADSSRFRGRLQWDYDGPRLFIRGAF